MNDYPLQLDTSVLNLGGFGSEADKLSSEISHLRFVDRTKAHSVAPLSLPSSPTSNKRASTISLGSTASEALSSSNYTSSNYWHVPDRNPYLTSVALQEDGKLCAIGSGNTKSNLFIYEVYPDEVTHHQTISLPEVHALKWVSPLTKLGQMGNVLASGHRNGVAHLTLLPDSTSRDGQAEVLKRYNHAKHLPKNVDSLQRSLRIRELELTSLKWSCCAPSSLFTLCGDHLFLWEPNRSDVPLVMQKTNNTQALSLCGSRDGVFALGRKRGVCIRDIRIRDRVNSGLKPPVDNDDSVTAVSWNPYDGGNQLASVHDRRTIKIWDIRSRAPLASYSRHADTITSLDWSAKSELVSASVDGTVRVWNTETTPSDTPLAHKVAEEKSPWGDYNRRQTMDSELDGFASDLLTSSAPVNQSRHFLSMALAPMGPSVGAVTIDSGGYLGVHELTESDSFSNFASSSFTSLVSSDGDFLSPH